MGSMDRKFEKWSKTRRFDEACRLVVHEGFTQSEVAKRVGVSRQHLSGKVKLFREAEAVRVEGIRSKAPAEGVTGETRMPFWEWERRYFGHVLCPDCQERHAAPPFHEEIVDALEEGLARILVNLPPYHAKSTLITVKWTLYQLCYDPNLRFLIVSKSATMARAFSRAIQELMTNEDLYVGAEGNLIDDFGPFRSGGKDQIWSATQFNVAKRTTMEKDPSVRALGVGEQVYGARADWIIFDDVATIDNQKNPDRVAGMMEWFDKEALTRIGKRGKAVWVGTRVMPGDIYATLQKRQGYRVIRKSLILDDVEEKVLWPEHFPYTQALTHRTEMKNADFQLVFQNVDSPGEGASFTEESIDLCKDTQRVLGQYNPNWKLIAGLDPAGTGKNSGFTALTLVGVDLQTGIRYLIDQVAERQMKAPRMKQQMLDWAQEYPLSEFRVEVNGVQAQIVQTPEIVKELAQHGVRVVPHTTHRNKWDPQFGVESIAPLFEAQLISIPWGNAPTQRAFQPFVEELLGFPMAVTSDRVMSFWFTHIAMKEALERPHLPMFDDRADKYPARIRRRRSLVSFAEDMISQPGLGNQHRGKQARSGSLARAMVGRPGEPMMEATGSDKNAPRPVNVPPNVWGEQPDAG